MRFASWAIAAGLLLAAPGCTVSFDFPTFVGVTRWPALDAGPPSPRATLDFVSRGRVGSTETFMPYWGAEIGERAEGIGLGDLDDDGDLDAVVSSAGVQPDRALVLRDGLVESGMRDAFTDAPGAWLGTATPCETVARTVLYAPPLLIIAPPPPSWRPCAYRQTGDFELTSLSAVEMPVPASADLALAGDVSGDGQLDVLFGGQGRDAIWLFSSRDHWEAHADASLALSDLAAAALADLDGDHVLDLVTLANAPMTGGHMLRGLGHGAFASTAGTVALETRGAGARRLAVADLDADARADLALFQVDAVPATVTFFWNRSDESGLAFETTSMPLSADLSVPDAVAVVPGDVDDDGATDIVITIANDSIVVLQNHGDRTFSERVFTASEVNDAHSASVGDVDLDGDLDVVICWGATAEPIVRECSILENQTNGTDFLELALRGAPANAHAVGARVVVFPAGRLGDFTARPLVERHVMATTSMHAPTLVHVGLPQGGAFDVRVFWPDGATPTDILSVPRGEHLRVVEP